MSVCFYIRKKERDTLETSTKVIAGRTLTHQWNGLLFCDFTPTSNELMIVVDSSYTEMWVYRGGRHKEKSVRHSSSRVCVRVRIAF